MSGTRWHNYRVVRAQLRTLPACLRSGELTKWKRLRYGPIGVGVLAIRDIMKFALKNQSVLAIDHNLRTRHNASVAIPGNAGSNPASA